MKVKTILITGATSGIGKATALKLAQLGHKIILLSRDNQKLQSTKTEIIKQTNNENVYTIECNLSSQKSIICASEEIHRKFNVIDVLINNAAIHVPKLEVTEDGIEKTFATNHLAYFLLTGLLLDLIKKSEQGRIINVSSNCHNKFKFNLNDILALKIHGKYNSYCRSKLANIMFTISLAEKLYGTKITVNALHPGLILTNIGMDKPDLIRKLSNIYKRFFAGTPGQGAETSVYLATSNEVENVTGKYFVKRQVAKYSKQADNEILRNQLWEISEKLTKFKYEFKFVIK